MKKLKNANLLIERPNGYEIKKMDILIEDHVIKSIGKEQICFEEINLEGRTLIPTFFNIHCHLGESIFRNIEGDDWNLNKYLEYTERYNKKLSVQKRMQAWKRGARDTIFELEKNGIYGFCAGRANEAECCAGMNVMAGYPIMKSVKLLEYRVDGLKKFKELMTSCRNEKLNIGIFLHSLYKIEKRDLILVQECMEAGAEFLTVHISENEETTMTEQCLFHKTAIQTLNEFRLLTPRTVLVHCGYITGRDFSLVADARASVAVCPISNCFLHEHVPDITLFNEHGIKWYLSTDGLGTGRTFSLTKQAYVLKTLYPQLSYQQLFRSFTVWPATIYNRIHYTGNIQVGTEAVFNSVKTTETDIEVFFKGLFEEGWDLEIVRF